MTYRYRPSDRIYKLFHSAALNCRCHFGHAGYRPRILDWYDQPLRSRQFDKYAKNRAPSDSLFLCRCKTIGRSACKTYLLVRDGSLTIHQNLLLKMFTMSVVCHRISTRLCSVLPLKSHQSIVPLGFELLLCIQYYTTTKLPLFFYRSFLST